MELEFEIGFAASGTDLRNVFDWGQTGVNSKEKIKNRLQYNKIRKFNKNIK